jgi:hypothetical protein
VTSNPQSCGTSCKVCPNPDSERTVATCTQAACGTTCVGGAPKCSDGSCARLSWTFDSTNLDGIQPSSLQVRSFNGSQALAVDVTHLETLQQGVGVVLPICVSGNVDLSTKTLSFRVYLDGTPTYPSTSPDNFVVVASVPSNQSSAFLGDQTGNSEEWIAYSSPLSLSAFSGNTTQITIQVASFGGAFSGTVWIDDITIQ